MSDSDLLEPVGIIGAGRLGHALARTVLRARRAVILANSRGPESLTSMVADLGPGVSAGTVADATGCHMVALAVPWASVPAAVAGLAWAGEIVIDATNALLFPHFQPAPLGGRTSSEIVAELVHGAWLVKAANNVRAHVLGGAPAARPMRACKAARALRWNAAPVRARIIAQRPDFEPWAWMAELPPTD